MVVQVPFYPGSVQHTAVTACRFLARSLVDGLFWPADWPTIQIFARLQAMSSPANTVTVGRCTVLWCSVTR